MEEQQSQAAASTRSSENKNARPAAEQAANRSREALMLTRARLQQQLEATTNPRYAEQLRKSLAELDKQIGE